MRIDVKTVKNKKYLQFVDKQGRIFHIGSASDFDSWLVAAILWNREWRIEYRRKQEDFFDLIENETNKQIPLDSAKINAFNAVRFQDKYYSEEFHGPLRVPKIGLFGRMEKNNNVKQRPWRPYKWCPNQWGTQVQKRLDEIYSKQRHLARKSEELNLFSKKEKALREIRNQRKEARAFAFREQEATLLVLIEMEKETGIVIKTELIHELTKRYKTPKEETERMVEQLLREGVIYEPRDGCLKKT